MFVKKYVVQKSDVDSNLNLKFSYLLYLFQEVAGEHADKLGVGRDQLIKNNNIWVVVKTDIHIERLPTLGEKIEISTHPGEDNGLIFPRYFQIYDKHHHLLVNAISLWVIINFETRRLVIRPFGNNKLPSESSPIDLKEPAKIDANPTSLISKRVASHNEVDVNKHINNSYYADYVLDVHDAEFYKEHQVKRLLINYDKEVLENDVVELYSNKENPEVIFGKVNDHKSFSALVEYEK